MAKTTLAQLLCVLVMRMASNFAISEERVFNTAVLNIASLNRYTILPAVAFISGSIIANKSHSYHFLNVLHEKIDIPLCFGFGF